jgi:hypothetical protein
MKLVKTSMELLSYGDKFRFSESGDTWIIADHRWTCEISGLSGSEYMVVNISTGDVGVILVFEHEEVFKEEGI